MCRDCIRNTEGVYRDYEGILFLDSQLRTSKFRAGYVEICRVED